VMVRATYDHRTLDGAVIARALTRLEQILNEDVAAEVRDMSAAAVGRLAFGSTPGA
jgi:hypothetical protein